MQSNMIFGQLHAQPYQFHFGVHQPQDLRVPHSFASHPPPAPEPESHPLTRHHSLDPKLPPVPTLDIVQDSSTASSYYPSPPLDELDRAFMAALLNASELDDFDSFLDNVDMEQEGEEAAAIVGGTGFVYNKRSGGGGDAWTSSLSNGGGYSTTALNGAAQWRPPSSYQPTAQVFPHQQQLLGGAPSSYAPPPLHVSRPPSFPISYANPPLPLPLQYTSTAPYASTSMDIRDDQEERERAARFELHKKELNEWVVGANAPRLGMGVDDGERPELGDEGRRSGSASASASREGMRRGYSHERPPLMRPAPLNGTAGGGGSTTQDDPIMQRMRQAEERNKVKEQRAQEVEVSEEEVRRRYRNGGEGQSINLAAYNAPLPAESSSSSATTFSAPLPRRRRSTTPPPPAPSQPKPPAPTTSTSTKRKAAPSSSSKAKAPRTSTSSALPNDTDTPSNPSLNPAPFPTPSNIPPSPFPAPTPSSSSRARPRPSPPSASTSSSTSANATGGKPALLTAEQKKANHIASEQKRRAAIRSGYEALCLVVPALRAAVEEFEERVKALSSTAGGGGGRAKKRPGSGVGAGGGGGAVAGPLSGGIEVGGEKVDGRAGPKSEAVVLGKTVEHLRHLLTLRQTHLERLSSLYSQASASGLKVEGGRKVWDEVWDGGPVVVGGGAGGGGGGEGEGQGEEGEMEEDAEGEEE